LNVDEQMAEIGEPHASTIFRIVQECLTNAARHAKASEVDVSVEAYNNELLIEVRDDGIGLPPRHAIRPGALGLIGMRERARLLGGEVRAENPPGGGAAISARLPLRAVVSDEVLR
jgi:two-component system, NarL family, sensor histidine kinase UhpB